MRTVLRESLRAYTRRYVAAALAVVIGVAFLVVTDALVSATRNGLTAGVGLPFQNADAVVTDVDGTEAAALVARARNRGESAAVLGLTRLPVSGDAGLITNAADVGAVADRPAQRWVTVVAGRFPDRRGEAVADAYAARANGVDVGDRLRVGSGNRAVEVTVVGLVESPSALVTASLYLVWDDAALFADRFDVDSVAYDGVGPAAAVITDLEAATTGTVHTRDTFVADRTKGLSQGVDVQRIILLLFAAIALFVAVLVIANTYSILFAQRSRELALLRCVGATRRQLVRSVRVEALLLGAVAAGIGVVAGVAIGQGLVALAGRLAPEAPLGEATLSPLWLAGAYAVGVGMALVAAWLPTRRVARLSPQAALQPDLGVDARTAAGRGRILFGIGLVGVGVALLALAAATGLVPAMIAGGVVSFTGLLLLGPVVVPALVRVAGFGLGRVLGSAGRLATANAVRNPRRTAATTASLLVGVTLTTAVLTGLASSRVAVDGEMDVQHPLDATLTATVAPLSAGLVEDVRGVAGVTRAVAVQGAVGELAGSDGPVPVLAMPSAVGEVSRAAVLTVGPDELRVAYDGLPAGRKSGDRVRVTVGTRSVELTLRTGEGWGTAALVTPATLARLTDEPSTRAIWVRTAEGVKAQDVSRALEVVAAPAGAELATGLGNREWVDQQLDIATLSMVALLGIAVLIALVGIGNTLGLSVLERVREHALLRALGLTRRQLRAMLAAEATLVSAVATALGTVVGVAFAWVGVLTMVRPIAAETPLVLPWTQLLLVVVVAAAAGLLASVLPARRGARVIPAEGLAWE